MTNLNLYDHLYLNEGAYFFGKGKDAITKESIETLFMNVSNGNTLLERRIRTEEGELKHTKSALCSLIVFSINSLPTFLNFEGIDSKGKEKLSEKKLGYLLVVEIDSFVVIIKKNAYRLTSFLNLLKPISGGTLGSIFASAGQTKFQQVRLTNMSMNPNAIRNRAYEGEDLESTMPMFNANNQILSTVRLDDKTNGLCTLNISTSRVSKFGNKKNLKGVLVWIDEVVEKLRTQSSVSVASFVSKFALPVSWKDERNFLTPTSILFNKQELLNKLGHQTLHVNCGEGRREMSEDELEKLKTFLGYIFRLHSNSNRKFSFCHFSSYLGISLTSQGLRLYASGFLKNIEYEKADGTYEKLYNLINRIGCFSVSFDKYEYIYYGGRLYKNNNLNKDVDSIVTTFEVWKELSHTTSEKGQFTSSTSKFDQDSVFGVVESKFDDSQFLVCDDLGKELADHIAIGGNRTSFIHSKSNGGIEKTSLSASNFHIVLSQAIKNIGFTTLTDSVLESKKQKFCGEYRADKVDTKIRRMRKGSFDDFLKRVKELRVSPNHIREVCIAVNFISKKEIEVEFNKMKHPGASGVKPNVVQLFWLLSGFISTCKDADLHCRIFCCE